ncbi:MAG: phosphoribosylglycinamide formyltransferase [Phycisphaerales bacterium]|nr:MAG: phosphoribosylglycinamide formyltransferase [Phycisphaerales bacterium]
MTTSDTHTPRRALPRLGVFISGGGRTLLNIHDHIQRGTLRAEIVLVVASSECPGAARARERGLHVEIHAGHLTPESLDAILAQTNPDWIVLAGYLKKLPILPRYRGRVVNIHPALLPKFGGHGLHGLRVHKAVLDARESISGCTVHLADDDYDTGPIILQRTCPVLPGDTPETLAARVFECEREAYPQALAKLLAS